MHLADRLFAYDNDSIGREFTDIAIVGQEEQRRIQSRRQQLVLKDWQESFTESGRIPKSALRKSCSFETFCLRSESLIAWFTTIFIAGIAGLLCALVIRHLHLQ